MNKVLMIGGPTGIGKSAVAVQLALRYNSVIIGADSMQIYKGMDIGTGKVTEQEKQGILHTMIDIVMPNQDYSVQKYVFDAKNEIANALHQGKIPIVVGGTGLYLNALINEQNFAEAAPNSQIREYYYAVYRERGAEHLHKLLYNVDSTTAAKISPNDVKRTIRALEIYNVTGKKKSESISEHKSTYDIKFFVLESERQLLYNKIDTRVDAMFQNGLIDEVKRLQPYWECRSMQAIGYKEIIEKIKNNNTPYDAIDAIKQNSRRYAKRQITFLKWIQAEKTHVSKDYYHTIAAGTDQWLNEGTP